MIASLRTSKLTNTFTAPFGKVALQSTAPTADQPTGPIPSESFQSEIPKGLENISPSRLAEMTARLENKEFVPGELLVGLKLQKESSARNLDDFFQDYGVKISERLGPQSAEAEGNLALLLIKLPEGVGEAEALAAMQDDSRIASADVNTVYSPPVVERESSSSWPEVSSWNIDIGQVYQPVIAVIDFATQTE